MPTNVTATPAAPSVLAREHFAAEFAFETDCWDVHDGLAKGPDFVLLDVRSPALFAAGHVPGAINLPHGKITERRMADWPEGTLFVVYCAGPHCNGADRAALPIHRVAGTTGRSEEKLPCFLVAKSDGLRGKIGFPFRNGSLLVGAGIPHFSPKFRNAGVERFVVQATNLADLKGADLRRRNRARGHRI